MKASDIKPESMYKCSDTRMGSCGNIVKGSKLLAEIAEMARENIFDGCGEWDLYEIPQGFDCWVAVREFVGDAVVPRHQFFLRSEIAITFDNAVQTAETEWKYSKKWNAENPVVHYAQVEIKIKNADKYTRFGFFKVKD